SEHVPLFHRFELMRHWYEIEHLPFEAFVSLDGLHMNDWSYACLAKGIAQAIAEAATRPMATASGPQAGREERPTFCSRALIPTASRVARHARAWRGHTRL